LKNSLEYLVYLVKGTPCWINIRSHDVDEVTEIIAEECEPMAIYTKCSRCRYPLRVYCEGDDIVLEELY